MWGLLQAFQAPTEKVYVFLNIGCLDWDYTEGNMLLLLYRLMPREKF